MKKPYIAGVDNGDTSRFVTIYEKKRRLAAAEVVCGHVSAGRPDKIPGHFDHSLLSLSGRILEDGVDSQLKAELWLDSNAFNLSVKVARLSNRVATERHAGTHCNRREC